MNDYCETPRRRTFMQRLFPARTLSPCDWDNPEPGFAPGEFSTLTIAMLDWRDRLRALVSGRIAIEVRSATDVEVKRVKSRGVVFVLPPSMKPHTEDSA